MVEKERAFSGVEMRIWCLIFGVAEMFLAPMSLMYRSCAVVIMYMGIQDTF